MTVYSKCITGLLLAMLLSGCASAVSEAVSGAGSSALQMVGLAAKEAVLAGPKQIQLRLQAGESVNSDKAGRGFAVVMRLYLLKSAETFSQLPREAFESSSAMPEALKQEALAAKEQVLLPAQRGSLTLPLPPEARFLGLVMLFQSKEPARWRVIVPVSALSADIPLIIGAHRCSFTITDGIKDKDLLKELSVVGSAACN